MVYICSKAISYETDQALKSNYLDTLLALCKTIKQNFTKKMLTNKGKNHNFPGKKNNFPFLDNSIPYIKSQLLEGIHWPRSCVTTCYWPDTQRQHLHIVFASQMVKPKVT